MRALLLGLCAVVALDVSAAELGIVYVRANVGAASGGHAALVAGETVYHLQADGDGRYRIARDEWAHFVHVYAGLQNRPLSIARVEVSRETRERVLDRFAREHVEQEIAAARREALAEDIAWLEARAENRPFPPLRAAGLLDPTRTGDPDALRLRESLREPLEAALRTQGEASLEAADGSLEALRERLALREALLALEHGYGLAPEAIARVPERFDDPLSAPERASLEALASRLERDSAELLRSSRPDRGRALLLAQARYTAVRRSLESDRLVLLDAFSGHGDGAADEAQAPDELLRARRAEYAGELLRRGRALVLAGGHGDDSAYNALEASAGLLQRAEAGAPDGALLDLERRKLPSRARSVGVPDFSGDAGRALESARARLAELDRDDRERWSYDLVRRNCITELARKADEALAGRVPADERLGFIPFVFFARVRERLPLAGESEVPSHRARELARVERESPGAFTRFRESTTLGSTIYSPRRSDGAFLLFTDDVFWRRPLYGLANLAWAAGYGVYGLAAVPFDRGERVSAGVSGVLWSLPELAFENVRKGSFEWVEVAAAP